MRRLLLVLLLLLPSVPLAARPGRTEDEELTPAERVEKEVRDLRGDAAKEHLRLASWCRSHRLKRTRIAHLRLALHLDPDSRRIRRELGYKRVDDAWVQNRPPDLSELQDDAPPGEDYVSRDTEIRVLRREGLLRISDLAKEIGLEARATELLERAQAISPQSEEVCRRLGFRSIHGRWFSPREASVLPETVECQEIPRGSAVGRQIGVSIPAWRSGGWAIEGADGQERIRYLLTVTRRGEALGALMRTGRGPGAAAGSVTVTILPTFGHFGTLLERSGLPDAQVANARATGQLWRQGSVVLSGAVSPDWFVHAQGAMTLWSLSSRVPSWLVSGFTDSLSERILGTMVTKFVTVERSAGLREGVEKQGSERWRLWLRNMALLGDDPRCGILFSSSLTGLTLKDVMKSWSLVEYLYRRDPGSFAKFAGLVLDGPTDKALREAYELTPDGLDEAWREWIVEVG